MHEMSLAEGVLQLIEEAAQREKFTRVRTVWLEVGQLASVDAEALAFCFDAVMRGSVAEGSRLEILAIPGSGWCPQCAASVPMSELYAVCPQCGSGMLQVSGGTEMRVRDLDVE